MITPLRATVVATLAVTALLGGCTGDDTPAASAVSVDAVRQAASEARPQDCPLGLDVPAALRSANIDLPVHLDSAEAAVSASNEPAADPIADQRGGLSALEAAAGARIECHYRVGDADLDVHLVATRAPAAVSLLAPQISRDAQLTAPDLQSFLNAPPGPGQVKIAGGTVAVAGLAASGGDAAVLISSTVDELRDAKLDSFAGTLTSQLTF